MISRVFQKSSSGINGGSATISSSSGSKKTRMSSSNACFYPEPSSPSSVYLPPLLESSPYAANTTTPTGSTAAAYDHDNCSYNSSTTPREHVSCFSTISAAAATAANNSFSNVKFDLAPPLLPSLAGLDPFVRIQRNNVSVSAFPSLRSLQENLQLPLFFSTQPIHGGSGEMNACGVVGSWAAPEEQRVSDGGAGSNINTALGPTELDCMWDY